MNSSRKAILSALAILCVFATPSGLRAQLQEIGETLVAVADPEFSRSRPTYQREVLDFGDTVVLDDTLLTGAAAHLMVLLIDGVEVSMAPDSTIHLTQSDHADFANGIVRVVNGPGPGTEYYVDTADGRATARTTSFLINCGPPSTAASDDCFYVGIYGTTQVATKRNPGQPVNVPPRHFTRIGPNQSLPDPVLPLPDEQFFALIDATTVVGTGSLRDRIDPEDEALTAAERNGIQDLIPDPEDRTPPDGRGRSNPQPGVPDQPIPLEPLPGPPGPPDGKVTGKKVNGGAR